MIGRLFPIALLIASAAAAAPPGIVPPASVSTLQNQIDAIRAQLPTPATTAPLAETTGGSAGTMSQVYALANHRHPRITDTQIVTTAIGGSFSVSYPAGFFSAPPTVDLSWVNTTAAFMDCELSADPTVNGASGRCRGFSLTGLLTLGAGIKVHVVSIPTTSTSP